MEHLVIYTVMHLLMDEVEYLALHLHTHLKVHVLVKMVYMMGLLVVDIVRGLFLLLSDHSVALDLLEYNFVNLA